MYYFTHESSRTTFHCDYSCRSLGVCLHQLWTHGTSLQVHQAQIDGKQQLMILATDPRLKLGLIFD